MIAYRKPLPARERQPSQVRVHANNSPKSLSSQGPGVAGDLVARGVVRLCVVVRET
jgi:hypothetical protein